MRKFISIILIVAVLLVAGCTQSSNQASPTPAKSTIATTSPTTTPTTTTPSPSPPSSPKPTTTSTLSPSQPTTSIKTFTNDITHGGYSWKDVTGAVVSELKVKKGDTVKILATSTPASHKHGITIDEFNINKEVTAEPGSTPHEISFTADKTGTFQIYCKTCLDGSQGGHPQLKTSLTVE